jgi:hypothetical protein
MVFTSKLYVRSNRLGCGFQPSWIDSVVDDIFLLPAWHQQSLLLHAKLTLPGMSELAEQMAPTVRVTFVEVGIESAVDIKTEATFGSIDECLKSYKSLAKNLPSSSCSDITIPSVEKLSLLTWASR